MKRNAILGLTAGLVSGLAIGCLLTLAPKPMTESGDAPRPPAALETHSAKGASASTPAAANVPQVTAAQFREAFSGFDASPQIWMTVSSARAMADFEERILASDLDSMALSMARESTITSPEVFHLIMSAYARKDPKAAWALAAEVTNPGPRAEAQQAVISSLAVVDPAQAFAMIDAMQDETRKRELRFGALTAASSKDPSRAWQYYQKVESGLRDSGDLRGLIFKNWASVNPAAAKAAAVGLKGDAAASATMGMLASIMVDDPQAAWRQALTLPSGGAQDEMLTRIASSWASYDPAAALRAAKLLSGDILRKTVMKEAIGGLAKFDLDAALEMVIETPEPSLQTDLLEGLVSDYFLDRRKLLKTIAKSLPAISSASATSKLLEDLAQSDPAEAAAAFEELPPSLVTSGAAMRIAEKWIVSDDKQGALEWLRSMKPGTVRDDAYLAAFNMWCILDFEEAAAALTNLESDRRRLATEALLTQAGQIEPRRALAWISGLTDMEMRTEGERAILSSWAKNEPRKALEHWQTLPDELRDRALGAFADGWAALDTQAAADWLKEQPSSPGRDTGLKRVTNQIVREDAAAALQWAMLISNEKDRADHMEQLVFEWRTWEPAACREWLEKAIMPNDLKDRLLK